MVYLCWNKVFPLVHIESLVWDVLIQLQSLAIPVTESPSVGGSSKGNPRSYVGWIALWHTQEEIHFCYYLRWDKSSSEGAGVSPFSKEGLQIIQL